MRHGPDLAHRRSGEERGEGRGGEGRPLPSISLILALPSPLSPSPLPSSRRLRRTPRLAARVQPRQPHWEQRADDEDTHVPLLSISGRLGVVDKKSDHVDAAFQLLLRLSGSEMSPQVSAASPATTLFRRSNLDSPACGSKSPFPPRPPCNTPPPPPPPWPRAMARRLADAGPGRIPGRPRRRRRTRPSAARNPPQTPCSGRCQVAKDHRPPRPRTPKSRLPP